MNAPRLCQLRPYTGLVIPAVRRVPYDYVFRKAAGSSKLARLAAILAELGVLTDLDAAPPYPPEATMVEKAIERWSTQVTGGLAVMGNVMVVVSPDTVDDYVEHMRYNESEVNVETIDVDNSVVIALCPWDYGPTYVLQRRCEALECLHPGLATTALYWLDFGLQRTARGFTPEHAHDFAEMAYGFGERQDEDVRLTEEQFTSAFPKWTYNTRPKLTPNKLQAIRHPVATALLDLQLALGDRKALIPDVGSGWTTAISVAVRWSRTDPTGQIIDDYVEDLQSGGEASSDFSVHAVALERKAVADFLDRFGRMLRILGACDRLIPLIAEPQ